MATKLNLNESRVFVLETAKQNIKNVTTRPGFVEQAKQVNASLASIVAMERNVVMLESLNTRPTNGKLLD